MVASHKEWKSGVFCLSFDFELAWGSFDKWPVENSEERARLTRERVFPRLLELLERYKISATWAVVGHLFLDRCDGNHGEPRPRHRWFPDWYSCDPRGTEETDPEWYGKSLVEKLLAAEPKQDVGLHGFSHCIWGDAGCSREVAERELENAIAAAQGLGVEPRSFVFPRGEMGHFHVLSRGGIRVFRGGAENWYDRLPGRVHRPLHIISQYIGVKPRTISPSIIEGMVYLPASYLFVSMDGFRRMIPVCSRVLAARKGLEEAVRRKSVFQMFTHPFNLAYNNSNTSLLLGGFERILSIAAEMRDDNLIEILNMDQIAQRVLGD
ncbi:MAG: polysaccharide deacetylase family protein [bacterium]